jgi:hypothetical protein
MKKLIVLLPLFALITACGTTDPYAKRAEADRERQEKYVERSINKAPNWMTDIPKSSSAVYASGTSTSPDMEMAVSKAKMLAYGKICMSAGGTVDQSSRVFRTDIGNSSSENSELAIRAMCRKVDVTGIETSQKLIISEGTRYRAYVLVALPYGEANQLRKDKLDNELSKETGTRAKEAFKELDQKIDPADNTFKPAAYVTPINVENTEYLARREDALKKPGAVVLQTSVN